jgi:geranylgeranyl diphosphate synthase type II
VFGKAIGGDITSNKKTYMLINALARANDGQRTELMQWIEAKTFDRQEKIATVTRLYDEIGIRQLCEEKINYYFDLARQTLRQVNIPDERKQALSAYMDELLHRNK